MKNHYKAIISNPIAGVTLVELSVVIVIVALVLGMVIKGQDMAHKARLDSAIVDLQKYRLAAQQFREKTNFYPGDINLSTIGNYFDDTSYWITNTPYGNGDGRILRTGAGQADEGIHAWRHLALTGMIPGTYRGLRCDDGGITITGCTDTTNKVIYGRGDGTDNIPTSRLEYEGGGVGTYWLYWENTSPYIGNFVLLGRDPVSVFTDSALNGILSSKNAVAVDRKIDDGHAQSGNLLAKDSAAAPTNCLSGGDYASANDQACVLWFNID